MATYVRRNSPTTQAFVIMEVSPMFHEHQLVLLDDNRVIDAPGAVGDYNVEDEGQPWHTVAKDVFEAEWMPA